MVKDLRKICKHCGYLGESNLCPACNQNGFAEKSKGRALILDTKTSIIGEKIKAKINGQYALKYN